MLNRIKVYLSEQLDIPVEEMDRDTTFESLHVDSLDMVEMVMDVEQELEIDLEINGDVKLETLGDLADYIEDKLA